MSENSSEPPSRFVHSGPSVKVKPEPMHSSSASASTRSSNPGALTSTTLMCAFPSWVSQAPLPATPHRLGLISSRITVVCSRMPSPKVSTSTWVMPAISFGSVSALSLPS